MLVLSRRTGQKIVIGNEIVIEVVSLTSDGVRLGISAPSETSVHRFEVFTEIQEANKAAQVVSDDIEHSTLQNLAEHLRSTKK